ncbi:hypothetical protein CYQ88_04535 [Hydrogenovibrio sp. SC-1]|uniref:DUF6635 family protein n=1 Tax=Hydrogenovibrio sp. SC-1 TaxID=2065820 RepID=UPI000C7E80D3|nr:DUF6635 family protein [Hydrogenovibrio sp. SC-1]PLA74864.1 hypothetical protein CYQ88_04535 [Hydrogenovibrio sp. SC-1]
MATILRNPELQSLLNEELDAFVKPSQSPDFRTKLDAKLAEYGATRTASSDLASNVTLLITSRIALGNASFGALSAGAAVSAAVANSAAISSFWLGSTAGSYYYAIFPVTASVRPLLSVAIVIAVVLAIVSTFIGILTDPLQAKLDIHQRRLRKLVNAISDDLNGKAGSDFHLKETYTGRLFDIVDVLSTVGRSL